MSPGSMRAQSIFMAGLKEKDDLCNRLTTWILNEQATIQEVLGDDHPLAQFGASNAIGTLTAIDDPGDRLEHAKEEIDRQIRWVNGTLAELDRLTR